MQKGQTMPGTKTIGNYVITKNLGEGTFGKVKLGIHSPTGEKVAVKILQKSKIVDVADVERVTREIHILKQIRHPNVIQLYEIIQTPKQLFLVMQYVSEGELFEHIVKKKRLKQNEACEFFRQLLCGVQYLHEIGIVHRDLKPENLLIDFNKRLKIVDFGLSNTYKHRQVLKTACGSPCYAAPEMIAGKKYQGLNADIWSCGVVLFAMVCGYLPFEDPNTTALYKKIISGDFSIPKFVSPSVRDLLNGILTTDPHKRYTLRDIKNHSWYKQGYEATLKYPQIGLKVNEHRVPVDDSILTELKDYCEDDSEARKYIETNRHNHAITIYYLLLKRNLRANSFGQYDICSPHFNVANISFKKQYKERSQSTNVDLQEIRLDKMDRMGTAIRGARVTSRISQIRPMLQQKQHSVELKISDPPVLVDNLKAATYYRKKFHHTGGQKVKRQIPQQSLYEVQQPITKFNQTISGNWRKQQQAPSFRTSANKSPIKKDKDRYTSLDTSERYQKPQDKGNPMNRTFVGKFNKGIYPKWQNESERLRSILNSTITGHGKRKHKFNIYY